MTARCRRAGGPRPRQRGFTLLEILLATALLAAGLALGFATLQASTATVERGETLARESERMRAASTFLRRRLGGALPMAFEHDAQTGLALRFDGEADRMRFVAELPDYLGRGGPSLHELSVLRDGDALQLAVAFTSVVGGAAFDEREPRPPEPLARGLRSVRFSYRGIDATGAPTPWLDRWAGADELPLQVRIEIADARGAWPPLLVALPQGSGRMISSAGPATP
ncbi:prepilin-type N-terminal cleavage/methylation domain-containing protein [Luteimonas sp. Y-2-2-4F]|nr:prepilin-type N-terminal cleavage/methylation domain-containing protein [Luteimonas sp. Y-2-2-4F]